MSVTQEPPEWLDGPPATDLAKGRRPSAPPVSAKDIEEFHGWLGDPTTATDLKRVLPDYIDLNLFLATCKEAALSNVALLAPNLRPSLLRAVAKAARQGLRPDGREGALVPRWNDRLRCLEVTFQPMWQGVVKLGRLTGAIKSIRPVIVFVGEEFAWEEGDSPAIRHTVNIDVADAAYRAMDGGVTGDNHPKLITNSEEFMKRIKCAYCVITDKDGEKIASWMPVSRIALIRKQQGKNTPWYGPYLDGMVKKTIIHATCKLIDLDITNPATARFREALEDDLQIDLEREPDASPVEPGQIGRESRLEALERVLSGPSAESVPDEPDAPDPSEQARASTETAEPNPKSPKEFKALVLSILTAASTVAEVEKLTSEAWYQRAMERFRKSNPAGAAGLVAIVAARVDGFQQGEE